MNQQLTLWPAERAIPDSSWCPECRGHDPECSGCHGSGMICQYCLRPYAVPYRAPTPGGDICCLSCAMSDDWEGECDATRRGDRCE